MSLFIQITTMDFKGKDRMMTICTEWIAFVGSNEDGTASINLSDDTIVNTLETDDSVIKAMLSKNKIGKCKRREDSRLKILSLKSN